MSKSNRWLLPEGVEEILPNEAWAIEYYQRKALDLFSSWGYELVIPPLIEYTDSLLVKNSSDAELQTFQLVDQLSGRSLGIRADITPQTCRIDAHSFKKDGPTRLCYAGTVLHSVPKSQLASRTPIEVGAELFGESGLAGSIESLSLMIESLQMAGVGEENIHLDLGNVSVYRALIEQADLSEEAQADLIDAFDRKAQNEVEQLLSTNGVEAALAEMIAALVGLHGDESILAQAKAVLANAPTSVQEAIDELAETASYIQTRYPRLPLFFDLAELRGFAYHTGLVFAAYVDGVGHSVANGGRFDNLGESFGRARAAVGFTVNVKALLGLVAKQAVDASDGSVLIPSILEQGESGSEALRQAIADLRAQGESLVCSLGEGNVPAECSRQLVLENGQWLVKAL